MTSLAVPWSCERANHPEIKPHHGGDTVITWSHLEKPLLPPLAGSSDRFPPASAPSASAPSAATLQFLLVHKNSEPVESHLLTPRQGQPLLSRRFLLSLPCFSSSGAGAMQKCHGVRISLVFVVFYFPFCGYPLPFLPQTFQFPLCGIKPKEGSAGNFPPL